jgi:outer membrane protein, heavy metal efflux system
MSSSRRITALVVFGLALGRTAGAQPLDDPSRPQAAAKDPFLDALVTEALERNPDLLALREAALAARARPEQVQALADPMLTTTYTNDGWSPSLGSREMTTLAFMVSQELPFAGKRRLRAELSTLDAVAIAPQAARSRRALVAAVTRAYVGLVLSRELLKLATDQERLWKQIEGTARARYAVGQGAQPDVLRVQTEVTRVEQLRTLQQAEASIRAAELNRLLDRPPASAVETAERLELEPFEESLASVLERLTLESPELYAAALAGERAGLAVAVAQKEYKPDFSVQAGYMNRGGLDPMWQAGIGINLPLQRRRRDAAVGEAEARLRAGERRQEAVRLQLRYRTQERLLQLQAAERLALLYRDGIIPQGQMSVEAAIASYQAGKVPFVAVLEALATLYDDRARHLRILAGHERIRARLEEASLDAASDMPEAGGPSMSPMPGRAVSAMGAGAALGGAASAGGMSMGSMGGR